MNPSPVLDLLRERLAPLTRAAMCDGELLALDLVAGNLEAVVRRLGSEFGFDLFIAVSAADRRGLSPRFDMTYHFYSTVHRVHVRLKTHVPGDDPAIDTLVPLYGCARFMERECHDTYGIVFRGHPDSLDQAPPSFSGTRLHEVDERAVRDTGCYERRSRS